MELIKNISSIFVAPAFLHLDNGVEFLDEQFEEGCENLSSRKEIHSVT